MTLEIPCDKTIVVSFHDLVQHPHFEKTVGAYEQDFVEKDTVRSYGKEPVWLNKMLWLMGLNIKKSFEVSFCEHIAPISEEKVKCERYYGLERTDREWKDFKKRLYERNLYKGVDERTFIIAA